MPIILAMPLTAMNTTASLPPDTTLYWNEALSEDLLSFLTGRIKCPEAAADLTQETFLRFHQFVQTTPPQNARALAFGIAVNLATDYQRKMQVRRKVLVEGEPDTHLTALADTGPERIVMARQQLAIVHAALAELPEDCRNAFILQSSQGLTQAQIAARLGVSQIKVYRLLLKAMSHCQHRLNELNEPKP